MPIRKIWRSRRRTSLAGLGGGFPVSGGTSQSLVNEEGGRATPLSTALAAVFILIVVLFFSHLLSALPQPVLAAVVLVAVAGLLKLSTLKAALAERSSGVCRGGNGFHRRAHVWFAPRRDDRGGDLACAAGARFVPARTLLCSDEFPAPVVSRTANDMQDNELIPNVMIFRPESALVYFNVDNVCDAILSRVRAEPTPPKLVVLDLSAAPLVDMQSAYMLAGMADELIAERIQFQAVEARSSVRDRLRHEGVDSKLGGVNRFATVADVIDHFQRERNASPLQPNEPNPTE